MWNGRKSGFAVESPLGGRDGSPSRLGEATLPKPDLRPVEPSLGRECCPREWRESGTALFLGPTLLAHCFWFFAANALVADGSAAPRREPGLDGDGLLGENAGFRRNKMPISACIPTQTWYCKNVRRSGAVFFEIGKSGHGRTWPSVRNRYNARFGGKKG
jgi:hypothetical protein